MKLLLLIAALMSFAHAESGTIELETKASEFQEVLEGQEREKEVSLSAIRLRMILDSGIEIPGVTNAKLSPEIELFFTKSK